MYVHRCFQHSLRYIRHTSPCYWQNFENERHFEPGEDYLKRTWYGLTYDLRRWKRRYEEARKDAFQRRHPIAHMKQFVIDNEVFPFRAEILIIGGGLTGSSTAYWLKERFRDEDFKVVVVENNDTFNQCSTMLSTGGISQQFSIPEHIEMSLFTAEFLRHAGEHLRILDNATPDINLLPNGFLYLARDNEEVEIMKKNWKVQMEKGACVALLPKEELQARFPFMNFDDVILGSLGLENEGTFDTWQLLSAIREKNITLGVQYVKGEVEGFQFERRSSRADPHAMEDHEIADQEKLRSQRITAVLVRPQMTDSSARPIRCHLIVNAAGPWAGKIAELAGIGKGEGLLAVPVPIRPAKRTSFVIHAPDVPVDMPLLVDPSGVHCRQIDIGNTFVVGQVLPHEQYDSNKTDSLEVNYNEFYHEIWPVLVRRVPAFKTAKIKSAWCGYQDVNTFDSAPVIGEHLLYQNLHMLCGFGDRGAMHSLAAGRAFAERIFDGAYININLRKFDMRRIMKMDKLHEAFAT
ncbi:FAD dependent oxidoreductase [Dictyocaulus viviparus]|uniref:FAD-dependent oxidoreductase domain-containing protein 1 n=1 Tax=Dictyocaulus viviparus TaxID=29172 RepID=A0A0D8XE50_DICVI|nr:FAD dependent oxidoreductase [Dictyocaulus viviparus]